MARLLLADDDDGNRETLAILLEDEGFVVQAVCSAKEVGEALAVEGDAGAFDLVLLDQNLGDGKGTDLLPLVRARLPGVKAFLLTGESAGSLKGADLVLEKGVAFPDLLAAIQRALG